VGTSKKPETDDWGDAKRNRSVGTWGEHIQYAYPNSVYVYVRNGIVTSFQD